MVKYTYLPTYMITSQMKILTRFSIHQEEIKFILSSLDINKSAGQYNIPSKVTDMLKSNISEQLADLFNLSFTRGTFPTLLKTVKVISIHKKGSKSNFTNYCLISLLSNLDKAANTQSN